MQQTRGYKVLLLAGSGVGGGTSINWTTSLKNTNDNILNEWDSLTGQNNYFNSSMNLKAVWTLYVTIKCRLLKQTIEFHKKKPS